MLLTLKQSAHHGFKSFHDYSPPTPPSSSRFSPALTNAGPSFPPLPPATQSTTTKPMSTPHRGLPPPAAMTLPQPTQAAPSLSQSTYSQPPIQLPAPPQQWQGSEEAMRNWLQAKSEEDKRKQEEEKTRQEGLRLEQRKVEQDMLRTSINGGIPPHMIPIVFAGMGGANPALVNTSLEWAQHFMAQAHQLQQQQLLQQQQQQQPQPQQQQQAIGPHPHSSPELRRESRQITQIYGQQGQHPVPAPLPSTPIGPGSQQPGGFLPSYPMSPGRNRGLPGPASLSRLPPTSELPRLNTAEMHIHQPPQGPPGQPSHPLQQSQSASQSQQESSPSIYFHHWQPPTSQPSTSGANQPATPSDVPAFSPTRKRKAQGPQQAAPPPSSQGHHASPSYSHGGSSASVTPSTRRRGHSRQRSDLSSRGMDSYGAASTRHRHSESLVSTVSGVSPTQQQGFESATPAGTPGGQNVLRRSSVSERSDTRPSQPREESDLKQEERDSEDRESSSRTSSKRDETRD